MTVSRSLNQAEKNAISGNNDSQDSQAILEAYRAEFGVETLSDPPLINSTKGILSGIDHEQIDKATKDPEPLPNSQVVEVAASAPIINASGEARHEDPTTQAQQTCLREAADRDTDNTPETNQKNSTNLKSNSISLPCNAPNAVNTETLTRHEDLPCPTKSIDHATRPRDKVIQRRPITAAAPPPKKMEFSQQTPTQVNDDRDYSEYCSLVPSSPINETTQNTSHEPGTLDADDTGAVNFGNLSELARPSSQVSEDAGFENTRGDWRLPDGTSQNHSSNAYTPYRPHGAAFETPAVPKNPFAARTTAVPLAGSQLFGQTQFSSAIKKISPTSSRPSPNLFHHSISPNILETSPLKNRANVSSPTDIRTSSPLRLLDPPETSSREKDGDAVEAETPRNSRSQGGDMIPESPPSSEPTPRAPPPRSSGNNGPMAHYEPMKKSQERKNGDESLIAPMEDDSDSDDPIRRIERRKRIERKRAKAAEEMERVSFTPKIKRDSSEQPVRKRRRIMPDDVPTVVEKPDLSQTESGESAPLVDDSQHRMMPSNETLPDTLPVQSTKATPGDDIPEADPMDQDEDTVMEVVTEKITIEEEMIPATSPAASIPPTAPPDLPPTLEPELPTLVMEPDEVRSSPPRDIDESSSLPMARRRSMRTYGRGARLRKRNPFISSSDAPTGDDVVEQKSASSPIKKLASSVSRRSHSVKPVDEVAELEVQDVIPPAATISPPQSSKPELPPPMTTRSRSARNKNDPITPLAARSIVPAPPTSSSLSLLSQTPVPSAKTTPGTQNSPMSERPESVTLPSPKDVRKRPLRAATKSESPQPVTRATRMAKRAPRLDSESTDELHYSPSASALEKSLIQSKSSRSFRQSLGPTYRTCRLFEDMIFAISFQNQVKSNERNKLEMKITQAGGTILSEGFQEMFEHSAVMDTTNPTFDDEDALKLKDTNAEAGFTALIADSHSRKAKYMQALALGIPCLAPQWITTCLNKGAIVDWEPYVLCAGASAILGNAIRSRNLIPYSAVDASFVDIIDQRTRLLDGQRVLVVVDSKKARSEAKQPYIFLATVLGPSITRVFTVEQARETLQQHQKAGTPFDWLYIDKLTGKADAVLAPPEPVGGKRRRKSTQQQQSVGNIRVLDDELVIQSLILGRMVEEDEMNF